MTLLPSLPECDVVIVAYRSGPLLLRAVASALEAGAARVIVVDNASRDGSIERLQAGCTDGRLTILCNSHNLGFAAACNRGARHATAPSLLFLNPDCELSAQALSRLLEQLHAHPRTGMVGGLLVYPDGAEQAGGRRDFPTLRNTLAHLVPGLRLHGLTRSRPDGLEAGRPLVPDFVLAGRPLPLEPTVVDAISGACMLVRREALDEVGPLDEGYFLHCEDLDWCKRFALCGWKVVFVPDARVVHVKGTSSERLPLLVEWHKHRGMLRYYRKFLARGYPRAVGWLVALGVWVRFALVTLRLAGRRLASLVARCLQ